jgi:uncharacterized repeat protein (TIGR01451 family)
MNKFRLGCLIGCFALLCLATFGGLLSQPIASAQSEEEDEAPPPEETFELEAKYPALSGPADTTFEFEVGLSFLHGKEAREFELSTGGPEGWLAYVCKSTYETDQQLTAIRLETYSVSEKVVVIAIAPFWLFPEPGDYTVVLEAVSKDLKLRDSIELTATITARYELAAETTSGRLNTKATAGKESSFSITVTNIGTATLDKVTFSSTKPSGIANEEWKVTFKPENIEALAPLDEKEIEVTVKPPSKTIAGDYMTTLKFDADPDLSSEPPELEVRVAVSSPTRWGWIGAGIIAAVAAGLVLGFRRFGRR